MAEVFQQLPPFYFWSVTQKVEIKPNSAYFGNSSDIFVEVRKMQNDLVHRQMIIIRRATRDFVRERNREPHR